MLIRFIKKYIILVIIGVMVTLPILYFIDNYEFKAQNVSSEAGSVKPVKKESAGFELLMAQNVTVWIPMVKTSYMCSMGNL